jgi:hypothetical protein
MNQWFRRLAEVPGIEYECSPNIDRSLLPEHDAIPEIGTFSSLNGKIHDFIRWKTTEGSTSASPAHRWQGSGSGQLPTPRPNETQAQAILRQLQETLELPGILSDYHHALDYCCELLWKNRRSEPWVLVELQRLYLLEIQLAKFDVSCLPFRNISAFESLIRLYEKEGYLREAFVLAQLLDILYPRDESKDYWRETSTVRLRPRIDRLEAEDDA